MSALPAVGEKKLGENLIIRGPGRLFNAGPWHFKEIPEGRVDFPIGRRG